MARGVGLVPIIIYGSLPNLAAFWFNLHASGKGDMRTVHGACPIISGSKWGKRKGVGIIAMVHN